MSSPVVAVIDIGSNTIKLLVAQRDADGRLVVRHARTEEARISRGLGAATPRLDEAGMTRGVRAVTDLLAAAAPFQPVAIRLVATSAVRDAANGGEFATRVHEATGQALRVLDGESEARLIGRGLRTDPALAGWRDFHVFDLGGGSLEHLIFRGGELTLARSLPLGCVRLTETHVADPAAPLDAEAALALRRQVATALDQPAARARSGERAVFTGGTMSTARALLAAEEGVDLAARPPEVSLTDLERLGAELCAQTLAARLARPGMTPGRADVFPAAVVTVLTVAHWGGFAGFTHSLHNLRWGLADELLECGRS
jgi:exopolyphosphatase / guanosine-5'-triphosphate,3'-diphosphate pyrophosphatase